MPATVKTQLVTLPEGMSPDRLLTIKAAAELTGIGQWTLRHWIRQGVIPAHRIRGRIYFQARELLRWIESQAVPL